MTAKKKRHFSPPYPFISLRACVELTNEFHKTAGQAEVTKENALKYMGLDPTKPASTRAYAAITNFGLLSERRSGNTKKVSVTDLARKILLVKGESSQIKITALQAAALNYGVIRELRMRWTDKLPEDDDSILNTLMFDFSFSPRAAKSFLPAFKETYKYAQLGGFDVLRSEEEMAIETEIPVSGMPHVEVSYAGQSKKGLKEYPILLLGSTAFVNVPIPLSEKNRQLIMKWFNDNKEALTYSIEDEQEEGENE